MANTLISIEERSLTPAQVELLDRKRRRGQLFLVIGTQCLIVSVLLTLWTGQDLTYSPGWVHPIFYWNCVTGVLAAFFLLTGMAIRRGSNEFISY